MAANEVNVVFKHAIWAVPITILVIMPSVSDPINLPKLLFLLSISFIVFTHWILLKNARSNEFSDYTEYKVISFLFISIFLAMLIVGLSSSGNVVKTFLGATGRNNGLIYYLCVVFLGLICFRIKIRLAEIKYFESIFSLLSIVFSLYCVLQLLFLDPVKWSNPYNRVIGTLGNPNFSGAALAFFSIFWFSKSLRGSENTAKKAYALLLSIFMALLSWSTDSLQGLIIIFVGVSIVAVTAIYPRIKIASVRYGLIFLVGSVFIFMFMAFAGRGPLGSFLVQNTLKLRGYYANFGLQAMLSSPLNGVGVDNYAYSFRQFRTIEFVETYGASLSTNNAHSTPAQIGSSFGVIVFALYILLNIWIFYKAIKILIAPALGNEYKRVAILWLLVFLQSILSIEIIGLGLLNWILGAMVLNISLSQSQKISTEHNSSKKSTSFKLPTWIGVLSITSYSISIIPIVWTVQQDRKFIGVFATSADTAEGKSVIESNYASVSPILLSDASNLRPFLSNLANVGKSDEVERILLKLHGLDPRDPYPLELLAVLYQGTGSLQSELMYRNLLANLDPMNIKNRLGQIRINVELGQIAEAKRLFDFVANVAPNSVELEEGSRILSDVGK